MPRLESLARALFGRWFLELVARVDLVPSNCGSAVVDPLSTAVQRDWDFRLSMLNLGFVDLLAEYIRFLNLVYALHGIFVCGSHDVHAVHDFSRENLRNEFFGWLRVFIWARWRRI